MTTPFDPAFQAYLARQQQETDILTEQAQQSAEALAERRSKMFSNFLGFDPLQPPWQMHPSMNNIKSRVPDRWSVSLYPNFNMHATISGKNLRERNAHEYIIEQRYDLRGDELNSRPKRESFQDSTDRRDIVKPTLTNEERLSDMGVMAKYFAALLDHKR